MKKTMLLTLTLFFLAMSFSITPPRILAQAQTYCCNNNFQSQNPDVLNIGLPNKALPKAVNWYIGNGRCGYKLFYNLAGWIPAPLTVESATNCTGTQTCQVDGQIQTNVPQIFVPRFVCADQQFKPILKCPNGVITAIGCVDATPQGLIALSLKLGIGAGSGIAFLLILKGSFTILSSRGNPEGLAKGKDSITSAVLGLLFIILSVTTLQIIGFDILNLGGLGLGTR